MNSFKKLVAASYSYLRSPDYRFVNYKLVCAKKDAYSKLIAFREETSILNYNVSKIHRFDEYDLQQVNLFDANIDIKLEAQMPCLNHNGCANQPPRQLLAVRCLVDDIVNVNICLGDYHGNDTYMYIGSVFLHDHAVVKDRNVTRNLRRLFNIAQSVGILDSYKFS